MLLRQSKMSIISVRDNENNRWKIKVRWKVFYNDMKQQQSVIKTIEDSVINVRDNENNK